MEIFFSSTTERQRLPLRESLSQDSAGTLLAICSLVCDLVFETPSLSHTSLTSSLKVLASQRCRFIEVLPGVRCERGLSGKEQQIIDDASQQRYAKDDIEGAFYEYGGHSGIITAILFFRESEDIEKCWLKMHEAFRPWLVECAVSMVRSDILSQFPEAGGSRNFQSTGDTLQYLGKHAGRKRKRALAEATSSLSSAVQTTLLGLTQIVPAEYSCHESAHSLVALLYSLGPFPRDLLLLGLLPQKRWDSQGNLNETAMHNAELIGPIAILFSSQQWLDRTIRSCTDQGTIVESMAENGSMSYSISDQSAAQIDRQSDQHQAIYLTHLTFIAYILPRTSISGTMLQDQGKALLPSLQRCWEIVQPMVQPNMVLPLQIRASLVEASLSAFPLLDRFRRKNCMDMIDQIQDLDLPLHIRLAIIVQKSTSLRLQGEHGRSMVLIDDTLRSGPVGSQDMRAYCAYGRLLSSQAENAMLNKDFGRAMAYLSNWDKKDATCDLQQQVSRERQTVIARLDRYRGDFLGAENGLQTCLKALHSTAGRYHIIHHLSDVYCERDRPDKAIDLVMVDINKLRAAGKEHSKAFRRLSLPLAEAYILQGVKCHQQATISFMKGEAIARELIYVFEGLGSHDVSDQLNHVRSLITLARIKWHQEEHVDARLALKDALHLTHRYETFSEGNYYIGFIQLFLSAVAFKLHLFDKGDSSLALANTIFSKQMPRHFMPGLGSYFLSYLLRTSNPPKWPWEPITQLQLSDISEKEQYCLTASRSQETSDSRIRS